MRAFAALLAAAALAGCSVDSLIPDTGAPDAGPFAVSGTVETFPLAARWYAVSGGNTPSTAGLSLRLEDPYVAEHLPDAGVDVASAVGADGQFSFHDVSGRVALGLAAVVSDPQAGRVVPAETFLFEGGPRTLASAKAYLLPADFAAALATACGIADLAARGFLLGLVLDESAHPVSGAAVAGEALDASRLVYLGEDLAPLSGASATSASGAFLVAGRVELMNFSVGNLSGYERHKALARPGQAFLIVFQP